MGEFLERVIPEALSSELGQALVIIYCRHLCEPDFRTQMRRLVAHEPEVLRQFDALDELHAEFPFQRLSRFSFEEELELLYWHNRQLESAEFLAEMRRLCRHEAALLARFDQMDAAEIN